MEAKRASQSQSRRGRGSKRREDLAEDGCCCIVSAAFDGPGDCFVVTAANDDDLAAPQVTILRRYRDERLRQTRIGRRSTALYYRYGPYGARLLRRYPGLKPAARFALTPAVAYARRRLP